MKATNKTNAVVKYESILPSHGVNHIVTALVAACQHVVSHSLFVSVGLLYCNKLCVDRWKLCGD